MKSYKHLATITGFFVCLLLVSNVLSSAKIVDLHAGFLGIPLIFDAGLVVFPLCYVFGDVLTEVYGYRASRRVIWTGFFSSLILVLAVKGTGMLPGESAWEEYAGEKAYQNILGGIASGGIVVASLSAYLLGELSNSFVLAKLKVLTGGKNFLGRALGSTAVGQLLDTSVFVLVAAYFGVFSFNIVPELIFTNYLFKLLIELLLFPLTAATVSFLKKSEDEDYFDRETNFNPFPTLLGGAKRRS